MRASCLALIVLAVAPSPGAAQAVRVGGSVAALATRVDPIEAGDARTGAFLTQPVIMASGGWLDGMLSAHVMLNLEALTISEGELTPGAWGEGFMDKRHPHTWAHEAVVTGRAGHGALNASVTLGRGFAPFGTDDPMSRPFLRFPSNHHLAQIPERLVAIGALAAGPVTAELGAFNGDEPTGTSSLGRVDRFGDSWGARLTVRLGGGVELQGSRAAVESPEVAVGGGANQRKWSASARWQGDLAGTPVYVLGEWARTTDYDNAQALYAFRAWLVEAEVQPGRWRAAFRYEDATRPEEERISRYRSPRPHTDYHLLGITRWQTAAARVAHEIDWRGLRMAPFLEAGVSRIGETAGGVLDPATFYGDDALVTLSAGLRLAVGHRHERMGRYGAATASATTLHEGH